MELIIWLIGTSFTYAFLSDDVMALWEKIKLILGCLLLWPILLGFSLNA